MIYRSPPLNRRHLQRAGADVFGAGLLFIDPGCQKHGGKEPPRRLIAIRLCGVSIAGHVSRKAFKTGEKVPQFVVLPCLSILTIVVQEELEEPFKICSGLDVLRQTLYSFIFSLHGTPPPGLSVSQDDGNAVVSGCELVLLTWGYLIQFDKRNSDTCILKGF